mmetsp:Transcript_3119/g.7223  ORF Transcript_3119/g.7223 Transcript_3119/m.7223 type:complete len:223 (-) Transcript_3119:4242-4910(-)
MKKNRKSTEPTLPSAGREYSSVWNSVRRPFALGMRRKMRATRKTRSRERYVAEASVATVMVKPTTERHTTPKSNEFHASEKYARGCSAKSFSTASMRNTAANTVLTTNREKSNKGVMSAWVMAMTMMLSTMSVRIKASKWSLLMRRNTAPRRYPSGSVCFLVGWMSTSSFWMDTQLRCSAVRNTLLPSCFSFISLNLSMVTPTNRFMTKKDPTMMNTTKKMQ